MITIGELLWPNPDLRHFAAKPEMDPLTEEDALQEAQLLDVRFDALRSTVALLFELRTALQLREANTGVLVAYGVRELSWTAEPRSTSRTAWAVGGSIPRNEDRLFGLTLGMWPGAQLELRAESAAFFAGDVPGLDEAPPDYGIDDEATVRTQLAGWHSEFVPVHAVFLDPAPAS
ncbi:MAG: hypothetical protein ACXV5Q_00850 [Frankiaceae bacterium]